MTSKNTLLYGGAITVDLPSGFTDVSQIRQVPDHQEVYLDADGYSSIVIEILEYVEEASDEAALQYHFGDLIEGSGDATTMLEQSEANMKALPNHTVKSMTFLQTPPTPNPNPRRKVPEFTYIHLLLLRLKEQGTDIMITINIPHYTREYQKATEEDGQTQLMKDSKAIREKVLESFEIKEWGLFDG